MSVRNRRGFVLALAVVAGAFLAGGAARADGPWLVVASQGDSTVSAINLSTGITDAQQQVGSQVVGVATLGSDVAISDFLGGKIDTYHVQQVNEFFEFGHSVLSTSPELVDPEGIVPTGDGEWVLLGDGGTQTPGFPVGLELADLSVPAKLAVLELPSVYGLAYDPTTRLAYVLDGLSNQVAVVRVGAAGTLTDTGVRIDLHGSPFSTRFAALDKAHNRLLVSQKADGAVEVIDLLTASSVGRISGLGSAVGGIAITPDGAHALVAAYNSSWWAVLDLTTPVMPTDTGIRVTSPMGVPNTFIGTKTWVFNGNNLYFSATNSNAVAALDWTTLSLLPQTYPTGLTPAGMDLKH